MEIFIKNCFIFKVKSWFYVGVRMYRDELQQKVGVFYRGLSDNEKALVRKDDLANFGQLEQRLQGSKLSLANPLVIELLGRICDNQDEIYTPSQEIFLINSIALVPKSANIEEKLNQISEHIKKILYDLNNQLPEFDSVRFEHENGFKYVAVKKSELFVGLTNDNPYNDYL